MQWETPNVATLLLWSININYSLIVTVMQFHIFRELLDRSSILERFVKHWVTSSRLNHSYKDKKFLLRFFNRVMCKLLLWMDLDFPKRVHSKKKSCLLDGCWLLDVVLELDGCLWTIKLFLKFKWILNKKKNGFELKRNSCFAPTVHWWCL